MTLPIESGLASTPGEPNAARHPVTCFECIGIGDPVTDVLVQTPFHLLGEIGGDAGGSALIDRDALGKLRQLLESARTRTQEAPGGSAANVVTCIASLNPETACHFTGGLGEDATATAYEERLLKLAVRTHFKKSSEPSPVSICLVTPDGQRTMRTCLGAARDFQHHHLPMEVLSTANLVHCEGYTLYKPDIITAAASAVVEAGGTLSLDLASFEVVRNCWKTLRQVIEEGMINIVFCNEDEALELARLLKEAADDGYEDEVIAASHDGDEVKYIAKYLAQYCQTVVLTLGSQGAIAVKDGETARADAIKVTVRDTVGAGDTFCGAFLTALMHGASLQDCLDFGCAAGAEAVQCTGALLPVKSWNYLKAVLQTMPTPVYW